MPLEATRESRAGRTLIQGARIAGQLCDVRCRAGRIAALAERLESEPHELLVQARGGELLPGLHDHHLHLLSLAAARESVRCGPADVGDREGLRRALQKAEPRSGWIRGVSYHEEVAGLLDRAALDELRSDVPVRIQHRTGALWLLNSRALERLDVLRPTSTTSTSSLPDGLERDQSGQPTGRLYRADDWLQRRLLADRASAAPALDAIGAELASYGVTGLTDATPGNDSASLQLFQRALSAGDLQQRLLLMGGVSLPFHHEARLQSHSLKLVLTETALPEFDSLVASMTKAHADSRPVAIHCVTRAELVLALAALREAGCSRADRIEHASIAPPDCVETLRELGLSVVTQPGFVRERGDSYLRDVEPADRPWLYRCRGLLEAGVPLAGGTDAPYGDPDPWRAMAAALDRKTELGEVLQRNEALSPDAALALFTGRPEDPGSAARRLQPGEAADFCLLDRPWRRAKEALDSSCVRATFVAGEVIYARA